MEGGMGRKRSKRLAWRKTYIQQKGPIKHSLFSFSKQESFEPFFYIPNWFHCIYWLLYSPVYPPQDYDATLAFISVKIHWEQQERPLPHSNPHSWECPVHAFACLTKKKSLLFFKKSLIFFLLLKFSGTHFSCVMYNLDCGLLFPVLYLFVSLYVLKVFASFVCWALSPPIVQPY